MTGQSARSGPFASVRRALYLGLAALLLVALGWLAWIAGHIAWYRYEPPRETAFMAQRMGELRAQNPGALLRYRWVPYGRISVDLKRAMIASEDARFVDHRGFDWDGMQKALEKNQKKGRIVGGGSTITQQLAKNLFLSPAKSYWRKAEEAVVTVAPRSAAPEAADLRALPQRDRMGQRRVRCRSRGPALLRRLGGAAFCRTIGQAGGNDAQPATLRAPPAVRVPRRPGRNDHRADAVRRDTVTEPASLVRAESSGATGLAP